MAPPKSRGSGGGGDDGPPPAPRPKPGGEGDDSVAAQQEMASARLRAGRAGEASGNIGRDRHTNGDVALSAVRPDVVSPRGFVDNVVSEPRSVAGKSAQDIADQFTAAGHVAHVEQSTKRGTSLRAQQVRIEGHPEVTNIQVHPGGGRHTPEGSPYWKISTSTQGKIWVVPRDFRGADELGGKVVRYDE
ncbi:hypothetical protein [Actinoplanes sp. M2I2]|uniref:hypothetical protein n=1 Tax=Actinoplanes sp. M2I2 TaxID=1734444 RepID=UPI0020200CF9|nr:hypothetical protein [Actinoplanes sp. M2I2]